MDGNRRFAKANKIPTKEGHLKGFQSLINMLEWCLELDIKAITVYAFSIDNYKRPQEEVVTLMEMAKEKIAELSFKK
ncbi:Dehydrodolichyl diphosphate synthase 6 [Zancudomyces culisetae]|uniref:Dehydrodolichyl diphosphate synthase 6 n=1 Tax=Zancudomyces culisetae TaxID=1213189 RepID=A0A1R1PKN0_ZANCU|nr:Dehydrodolichyl diphosphate synthase 6 [Zancudomyces culisetae]OMH81442.1 Dehydrodolichyl diphosphate synthase 6 [Zancudomyces culisetae]|eukprot:OMH79567.1 Dehydrodolichyl diphosphate synthase 6 [Zancudomyces culisetae]